MTFEFYQLKTVKFGRCDRTIISLLMKKEKAEYNIVPIIENLFEKYKNEKYILTQKQVIQKMNSWFGGKFKHPILQKYLNSSERHLFGPFEGQKLLDSNDILFGLKCGVVCVLKKYTYPNGRDGSKGGIYFIYDEKLDGVYYEYLGLSLSPIEEVINRFHSVKNGKLHFAWKSDITHSVFRNSMSISNGESIFFSEFIKEIKKVVTSNKRIEKNNQLKSKKTFDKKKASLIKLMDKDGNGLVDIVEGNTVFDSLLQKHQKKIIGIDRGYIDKFVKVSAYLSDKKANIQNIFDSIKKVSDSSVFQYYAEILQNEIHTYNLILVSGSTMIVALVDDEYLTYSKLYESMDRINLFDSQWEKDVSQKLTNIGDGLYAFMYEIEASNRRIVNELSQLNESTKLLGGLISKELESIDSSIKFNNLLTGIQTYQMYKVNKNTKSLRE